MADEFITVADAFNAAKLGDPDPAANPDSETIIPESVEQPSTPVVEDPEASNSDLQALFDEQAPAVEPVTTVDVTTDEFWNVPVEIEDGVSLPLSDVRDGYMMQADYTRKTQALAERSRQLDKADAFYESFLKDPSEFARTVAVDQGWLTQNQTTPVREVEGVKQPTVEEMDARVEELVTERLASDPRYEAQRAAQATATINAKFDEVGTNLGVTIPNTVRAEIVEDARRRNVFDLELLTEHWMNKQREVRRSGEQLKNGAAARPQSAGASASDPQPAEVSVFADAVAAAKAELSA